MAYATKYTCEFYDLNGIGWQVDIEEDGFSGDSTTLQGAGDPLKIEIDNDSDDVFDPIKMSSAVLTVMSEEQFALIDLYASEDLQYRVKIYEDSALYWQGWIESQNYSEPYEDVPYPVTITAICGLKYLKNIPYDDDGTPYNGRRYESQIIIDILGKLEYTGFTEYVNIYEEGMDDSTDDSPMDQVKIDVDVFQDKYCDEVLSEVIKKWNACIKHRDGGFIIYRPKELIETTVYGRIFTDATTKSSTSFAPAQYINRAAHVTTRKQVPGGVVIIDPAARLIKIHQDYSNKISWIENWQFLPETWDGTDFEHWISDVDGAGRISDYLYLENEPRGIILPTSTSYYDKSTTQSFAYRGIYSIDDILWIEFEYMFCNYYTDVIANAYIYITIQDAVSQKYLKILDTAFDNYCEWVDPPLASIVVYASTVASGVTTWQSFKRSVVGLPTGGEYNIILWSTRSNDAHYASLVTGIRDIKFYITSSTVIEKQKVRSIWQRLTWRSGPGGESFIGLRNKYYNVQYKEPIENVVINDFEIDNSINGVERDYDYILGDVIDADIDNIIEQFAGSLAILQTRVDTITLTGTSGTCHVLVGGVTKTATWNTSLTQTAADFVTDFASFYDAVDITLTSSGANLIFTAQTKGDDFYNYAQSDYLPGGDIVNPVSGDLDGVIVYTTLSLVVSTDWNTRGGSESKPLLEIIADEIAAQYARPKQLIQMAIIDTGGAVSAINPIGHFIDPINSPYKITATSMPGGGNLIHAFYDNDIAGYDAYTTFEFTGVALTSVIQTATTDSFGIGLSGFAVTVGDVLRVQFTLTLNSGQLPTFSITKSLGVAISNEVQASDGVNDFLLTITESRTVAEGGAVFSFKTSAATNFSTGAVWVGNNPRRFIFNRGEFGVKFRKWMIDLMEIIN